MKNIFIAFLMLCSINTYCQKENMPGIWYRNFTDNVHLIIIEEGNKYKFINFHEKENSFAYEKIIKIDDDTVETSFTNSSNETMYFKYKIVDGPGNEKMLWCQAREEKQPYWEYDFNYKREKLVFDKW